LELGAYPVIVDGALSRKSSASPSVTEGVILSTGASVSRDMNRVVEDTAYMVKLLSIEEEEDEEILKTSEKILLSSRAGVIYRNGNYQGIDIPTSLEAANEISGYMDEDVRYIVVKGIITDKFLEGIMNSTEMFKKVTLLVEDGTRIFVGKETMHVYEKRGGRIRAMDKINLICLTANPKSPYGYGFDRSLFLEKLKIDISLPVYDVFGVE
jgi:hypothetical protein